jgi:hypothetical protein
MNENTSKEENIVLSSKTAKLSGGNKTKAVTYIFIVLGFLLALSIGVAGGLYFSNSSKGVDEQMTKDKPKEVQTSGANIKEVEGVVWQIKEGRRIEVIEGDEVEGKDQIETEEDSRVVIELADGSTVRVGESTSLIVSSLSVSRVVLTLDTGETFSVVEENEDREFIVETEGISVKALGTAFSVENYGEVKVSVFENKVEITEGEEKVEVEESFEYSKDAGEKVALNAQNAGEDNFLQWSLQQEIQRLNSEIVQEIVANIGEDATKEEFKQAAQELEIDKKELIKDAFLETTSGQISSITLSGEKTPDGAVSLSWTTDGLADNGFKVVWSQTPGKPYPGDKRTYKALYSYQKTLGPMKSGTWYYRVCEWTGETCGIYSNEVTISF